MPTALWFPQPRPIKVTLGDKLHKLAILSPADVEALEILVDDLLDRRVPPPPKRRRTPAA